MKNGFFYSLKSFCRSILKSVFLHLFCLAAGLGIVFPLWYFASNFPAVYTVVILCICALGLVFFIVKRALKSNFISLLRTFLYILISLGCFIGAAVLIWNGFRFFSIPVLILLPILWTLCKFFLSDEKK